MHNVQINTKILEVNIRGDLGQHLETSSIGYQDGALEVDFWAHDAQSLVHRLIGILRWSIDSLLRAVQPGVHWDGHRKIFWRPCQRCS